MYEIVRFLHKSLIAEEPSIKDKMKLSMEYFYSEALIKQQEIKIAFKCPNWILFFTKGWFVWPMNVVECGKVTC